jgi:hypothetical protein
MSSLTGSFLARKATKGGLRVVVVTLPPARSMSSQDKDVGRMHKTLKLCCQSNFFRFGDDIREPTARAVLELRAILVNALDIESFKAIWKFFLYISDFIEKTCTPSTIKSTCLAAGLLFCCALDAYSYIFVDFFHPNTSAAGFVLLSGVSPFSIVNILHVNPHFCKMSEANSAFAIASVEKLADVVSEKDILSEADFKRIMAEDAPSEDINNCPPRAGMSLADMVVVRHRDVEMSSPRFVQAEEVKAAKKLGAASLVAARKEALAVRKAEAEAAKADKAAEATVKKAEVAAQKKAAAEAKKQAAAVTGGRKRRRKEGEVVENSESDGDGAATVGGGRKKK